MGIQMRLQEVNHCQQRRNWLWLMSRVSAVSQKLLDSETKIRSNNIVFLELLKAMGKGVSHRWRMVDGMKWVLRHWDQLEEKVGHLYWLRKIYL